MSSPVAESTQPDVLIVGGGSAGAALAARLSEDANHQPPRVTGTASRMPADEPAQ